MPDRDRLTALDQLDLPYDGAGTRFDHITRLATLIFGAGRSVVRLARDRRAWYRPGRQLDTVGDLDDMFADELAATDRPFIVPDLLADLRFARRPLPTAGDAVRFCAGAPLVASGGDRLGTLWVVDAAPRLSVAPSQLDALADLARVAVDLIECGRLQMVGRIATQVVDASPDALLCTDLMGRILFWNEAAERIFGHRAADAIGRSLDLIFPDRLRTGGGVDLLNAIRRRSPSMIGSRVELVACRADRSEVPVELSLTTWSAGTTARGYAATLRDITHRRELERRREQTQTFLDTVVEHLPAMLFVRDIQTRRYVLINQAGEDLFGRPRAEVIGRTHHELFPGDGPNLKQRDDRALAADGPIPPSESDFLRDDGQVVNLRTRRIILDGPDRPRQYILGLAEDVTETRRAEAKVRRLSHYDTLTGLVNRHSYIDKLHELTMLGTRFALLAIDIARFKTVNDQFGHLVGDAVLAEVSRRLRAQVGNHDVVARIGGDEFAVLLIGDDCRARAEPLAQATLAALDMPVVTARGTAHLRAGIGGALAPDDAATAQDLRLRADLALYRAKEHGTSAVCFYQPEMDNAAGHRGTLEGELRRAIDHDELQLRYQPVIAVETGRISSVEALARWTHLRLGPIAPDVFVGIAEESGLIVQLGRRVLNRACRDAMTWPEPVAVAVNLSPLQFLRGDLFDEVMDALAASGLPAERLQLEVTEGLVVRDVDRTFAELARLREAGIKILIDDFGTGYSSLSYFERFPFDKIKIDKSFVSKIGAARAADAIVRAVVELSRALEMSVIGEGVETDAQAAALIAAGCTHLQGYLFSAPVATDAVTKLLASKEFLPLRGIGATAA